MLRMDLVTKFHNQTFFSNSERLIFEICWKKIILYFMINVPQSFQSIPNVIISTEKLVIDCGYSKTLFIFRFDLHQEIPESSDNIIAVKHRESIYIQFFFHSVRLNVQPFPDPEFFFVCISCLSSAHMRFRGQTKKTKQLNWFE